MQLSRPPRQGKGQGLELLEAKATKVGLDAPRGHITGTLCIYSALFLFRL